MQHLTSKDAMERRLKLRAIIARGRTVPADLDVQHLSSWHADSIAWERLSIVSESEASPNQRLPIIVARPEKQSGTSLPVVFVLHGTAGAKTSPSVKTVMKRYALKGWAAISFDCRYHGERSQTGEMEESGWVDQLGKEAYTQALVDAWNGSGERPFVYDSAWDMMRAIDYIEATPSEFDASRIGATGISLGGIITWIASAIDTRITVSVPAIGVQNFKWALDHNSFMPRIDTIRPVFDAGAAALGQSSSGEINAGVVQAVWDRILPEITAEFDAPNSLPLIAPRPLLVVGGAKDPRCPIEGVLPAIAAAEVAYDSHGASERMDLFTDEEAAHEITPRMWDEIDGWFERFL